METMLLFLGVGFFAGVSFAQWQNDRPSPPKTMLSYFLDALEEPPQTYDRPSPTAETPMWLNTPNARSIQDDRIRVVQKFTGYDRDQSMRLIKTYYSKGYDFELLQHDLSEGRAIDQCWSCVNYHGQHYNGIELVCGMHPKGVEGVCGDRE